MTYVVEMQTKSGAWIVAPSTRPLTREEATDEIRCARDMGLRMGLRIVERPAISTGASQRMSDAMQAIRGQSHA